jgi:hypothetical protein
MTPTSNNVRSAELNNGIVCECIGCYAKATDKITLKIGSKGTITLFLCENCKPRFSTNYNNQQNEVESTEAVKPESNGTKRISSTSQESI